MLKRAPSAPVPLHSASAPLDERGRRSRAQREREVKEHWESPTETQEVWALRKMGYFKIGQGLSG